MNDSKFLYVDDPTAHIRADGSVAVAWVDNRRKDVFFRSFGPDGEPRLDEPVNVSNTPEVFSWLPRLVRSPDGREVFLLWQEIVFSGGTHGGEAFFARSTDGGRTFSDPLNLSETTAGCGKGRLTAERWDNGSLDLVRASAGTLYAAWTEYQGPLRLSRSTDGGASFSSPTHVAGSNASPARGPSLAVGPNGTLTLAWTVGEDASADIHIARFTDGGRTIEAAEIPQDTDGHSDAPKITVGNDGTLHLVYAESPKGPFRTYHVRYTRRPKGRAAFTAPVTLSGPSAFPSESAHFPQLALAGAERLLVAWDRYIDARKRPRGLAFTASIDGGRSFREPSLVPGTGDRTLGVNGSLQGQLMRKLDANARGSVAVVNSRFRSGQASQVRLVLGALADGP
jgi:hypothetical protein